MKIGAVGLSLLKGLAMNNRFLTYFVKFFKEKDHANQFIEGNLYLNRISFFKKNGYEDEDNDGRPDRHEAISSWLQPNGLSLTVESFPELSLSEKDFLGPVSIADPCYEALHVLCMTATVVKFDEGLNSKEIESLAQKNLRINEECLKLGSYAVIVEATSFCNRIKSALQKRGDYFKGQLVEYYDEKIFNGHIAEKDIPFRKQERFSYQNEFRIVVDTQTVGENHITIEIGTLQDIAQKVMSSDVNKFFSSIRYIESD